MLKYCFFQMKMLGMDKKSIDWESIEKAYRLGQLSVREIARQANIQPSSITRKAQKENWHRDMSDEIRQRTKATLIQNNRKSNIPTREDIEFAVQTNVEVIRSHRRDISTGRKLVSLLSSQLEEAALNRCEIEEEIVEETKGQEGGKPSLQRRNMMIKAVSLPVHAGALRDLSTALKNLIPLERQAFNLDDDPSGNAIKEILDRLSPAAKQKLSEMISPDANSH